jgi:HD superfamily phosphohydrolase
MCVILAGMLHDLGHGPFSHMWEIFVHRGEDKMWTHEISSCAMVRRLFSINQIRLHDNPNTHDQCIDLITALIEGDPSKLLHLLSPDYMFLSEIVSNKYCNIDVDKIDYILRDAYHLRHSVSVEEFSGFLKRATIQDSHISYDADDFHLIENLFINRKKLHKEVYQHPKVAALEQLLVCFLGYS